MNVYVRVYPLYNPRIIMSIYKYCVSVIKLSILPFQYSIKAGIVTADANWTDDKLFSQIWLKGRYPKARVGNI